MRVFVTGSAGFVAGRLLPKLRARGAEVVGVDREVDVSDLAQLEPVLGRFRPEAIVHLAAVSSVALSWDDPNATFRVNYLGTRAVLQAVARHVPSARVLLIGSADQYGSRAVGTPPCREQDPLAPASPYARTKAAAELLGSLAAGQGFDVVRVRAFNHTGPGQSPHFVASSFARQIAEIAAGRREPHLRVGNLASVRDFLDVEDVVDAYLALLDPSVPAGIYNLASGRGVTIRSLLDQLLEVAGVEPQVEIDPALNRPTDQLIGDSSRLRQATDWRPHTALRTTLEHLVDDWHRRVRDTPDEVSGP